MLRASKMQEIYCPVLRSDETQRKCWTSASQRLVHKYLVAILDSVLPSRNRNMSPLKVSQHKTPFIEQLCSRPELRITVLQHFKVRCADR